MIEQGIHVSARDELFGRGDGGLTLTLLLPELKNASKKERQQAFATFLIQTNISIKSFTYYYTLRPLPFHFLKHSITTYCFHFYDKLLCNQLFVQHKKSISIFLKSGIYYTHDHLKALHSFSHICFLH